MLSADQLDLLLLAADGELPRGRRPAVQTLLAGSPAAAALLAGFEGDGRRVRALPRAAAPPGLLPAVMDRVRPAAAPARPARHRRTAVWAAVAASVAAAVGVGTLVTTPRPTPTVAQAVPGPDRPFAQANPGPKVPPSAAISATTELPPEVAPAPKPVPTPTAVAAAPVAEEAPVPRPAAPADAVGSALLDPHRPLEVISPRLPFLGPAADLGRPEVLARLSADPARDGAFRLDLFSRDPQRAADKFLADLRGLGLVVHLDPLASDRLAHKAGGWAAYTEALAADDLRRLLHRLAAHARPEPATFGTAHFGPAHDGDHREVRDLLGADPGPWKRPKPAPAALPSSGKSVTAGTKDQVLNHLSRPKGGERSVVLLAYPPPGGRAAHPSKDSAAYLDRRDERKPGSVPLLVTVRPAGN